MGSEFTYMRAATTRQHRDMRRGEGRY